MRILLKVTLPFFYTWPISILDETLKTIVPRSGTKNTNSSELILRKEHDEKPLLVFSAGLQEIRPSI